MNTLTRDEVLHVADLARLEVKENEIEKYGIQLFDILSEIEKINEVDINDDGDILIMPTENQNKISDDEVKPMLTKNEIMKNVKNKTENYIVVPEVLHD